MGSPVGKRPLGKTVRNLNNNINMGLKIIGFGDIYWIDLTQKVFL
jgi:hypothetical protein